MGAKFREYNSGQKNSQARREIHPIWRGVGFAMIVLIPIMAYAATQVLLTQNSIYGWYPFPTDLLAKPGDFLFDIFKDSMINIQLIGVLAFSLLFYAFFTFVSFMINSIFGVKKYDDPFYVPPVRRQSRRRR